jgi:hypothetical protein
MKRQRVQYLDFVKTSPHDYVEFALEEGTKVRVTSRIDNAAMAIDKKGNPIKNPDGTTRYNIQAAISLRFIPASKTGFINAHDVPKPKGPEKLPSGIIT